MTRSWPRRVAPRCPSTPRPWSSPRWSSSSPPDLSATPAISHPSDRVVAYRANRDSTTFQPRPRDAARDVRRHPPGAVDRRPHRPVVRGLLVDMAEVRRQVRGAGGDPRTLVDGVLRPLRGPARAIPTTPRGDPAGERAGVPLRAVRGSAGGRHGHRDQPHPPGHRARRRHPQRGLRRHRHRRRGAAPARRPRDRCSGDPRHRLRALAAPAHRPPRGHPRVGPRRPGPRGPARVALHVRLDGRAKAVMCSTGRLAMLGTVNYRNLVRDDVAYSAMPLFHGNALFAAFAPCAYVGSTFALRRKFSASGFLTDVLRFGATYVNYVGRSLSYILAQPERPEESQTKLRIVFGTEASVHDRAEFERRFHVKPGESYGSSEGAV